MKKLLKIIPMMALVFAFLLVSVPSKAASIKITKFNAKVNGNAITCDWKTDKKYNTASIALFKYNKKAKRYESFKKFNNISNKTNQGKYTIKNLASAKYSVRIWINDHATFRDVNNLTITPIKFKKFNASSNGKTISCEWTANRKYNVINITLFKYDTKTKKYVGFKKYKDVSKNATQGKYTINGLKKGKYSVSVWINDHAAVDGRNNLVIK